MKRRLMARVLYGVMLLMGYRLYCLAKDSQATSAPESGKGVMLERQPVSRQRRSLEAGIFREQGTKSANFIVLNFNKLTCRLTEL